MRHYLSEQRSRGAALIVTTHVLSEAELMADRIAIMRRGRVVTTGSLDELRVGAAEGRRYAADLAGEPRNPDELRSWLREHALDHSLDGDALTYSLPWAASVAVRAQFAAELQRRLSDQGAPYHQLE